MVINGTRLNSASLNGTLSSSGGLNVSGVGIPTSVQKNMVISHTTEEWAALYQYVSKKDYIYVYTDHQKSDEGKDIPGIKIGDGNAYVVDLPFIDDLYAKHISDTILHINDGERDFWNNKVTCFIDPYKEDKLIFTKN